MKKKRQRYFQVRTIIVIIVCTMLYSCAEEKEVVIPENVLSKEKMATVMTDIHLLEASMTLNFSNAANMINGPEMQATTVQLLKKNNVTREQYQTSFIFYAEHPDLLTEVYKQVLNNLSQLQAKVSNEKDTTSRKIEPIKKP